MESDDCRLARLITEMFWADLMSRDVRTELEKLTEQQASEIRLGWYLKALEIIRAESALSESPEKGET